MLERYLSAASTYAHNIDHLFLFIAALVGFWFVLAELVFFGLMFRFRRREGVRTQYVTGEEKHLKRWISIPHNMVMLCDLAIIVPALLLWYNVKEAMPPADQTVRVFSQQWAWSFQQAGPDGILDTADDIKTVGDLHVIVNKTYRFELLSRDVVHSFAVPAFRLKQDAVPGRTISGWFRANRTGTFDIQCTQICGIGHGLMAGRIIVETPKEHAVWLMRNSSPSAAFDRIVPGAPPGSSLVAEAQR
jgi:cytochrome c oxidase subunit 2